MKNILPTFRLGKFIYGPAIFSSVEDHELGIPGMDPTPWRTRGRKKGYGKGVKTGPDFSSASNLVGGRSCFLK